MRRTNLTFSNVSYFIIQCRWHLMPAVIRCETHLMCRTNFYLYLYTKTDNFMIALSLGWIATFFRAFGMICKNTNSVKKWVTLGNLAWMINGILTNNIPLVVCNFLCVAVMVYDYIKNHKCL